VTKVKVYKTRFKELGYCHSLSGEWRIVAREEDPPAAVGPMYRSRVELLCDLERYAAIYGCKIE
jgi:hypothetical protein